MTTRLSIPLFTAMCLASGAAGGLLGHVWPKTPGAGRAKEPVPAEPAVRPATAAGTTPFARALDLLQRAIHSPDSLAETMPTSPFAAATLAATMAERNPGLFLTWLARDARSNSPAFAGAARFFFAAWLAREFDAAVSGARSLPKGASRMAGLELALELLCARNAGGVADFLRTHAGDLSVTAGLREWIKGSPRDAAGIATTLPAGRLRTELYLAATNAWADKDPATLLTWSAAQNGMDAGMAGTPAFEKWASKDPAGLAAAWPQFSMEQREASACEVARGLTAKDPAAALSWVMANTNGFLRYGALRSVFGAWPRADLTAAAAAALTLPGGTSQQAAAEMLTGLLVEKDPAAARTWGAQLAPGSGRASALKQLPAAEQAGE